MEATRKKLERAIYGTVVPRKKGYKTHAKILPAGFNTPERIQFVFKNDGKLMKNTKTKLSKAAIAKFKAWGSLGGKKARGEAKTRSPEHYKAISKLGVAARLAKLSAK